MTRPSRRLLQAAALVGMAAAMAATLRVRAEENADRPPETSKSAAALAATPSSHHSNDGVQPLLLLAPDRPLRIDLILSVDGKSLVENRQARFDRLFGDEDTKHQGSVEVARAVHVCEAMSGEFNLKQSHAAIGDSMQKLAAADKRVDRQSLLGYIEKTFPPFSVNAAAPTGTTVAAALFDLLDANHDGQLSKAELEQAATRLLGRDFDDDQLISERELIIDPTQAVDRGGTKVTPLDAARQSVIVLTGETDLATVAATVLKHYDHNGDGRLALHGTDAELFLPAEISARADANQDGFLDAAELRDYLEQGADVILPLEFGSNPSRHPLTHKIARPVKELRVRRKIDGGFKLYLGDAQIDVNRNNRNPTQNNGPELRFARFDADKNGYLDKMEVRMNPLLAASFEAMDTDGDGKITPGEFSAYIEEQTAAAAVRIVLQITDRGQDLFSLLDTNGDGLLTLRELQAAPAILDVADRNHDGVLSGLEIPQRWTLEVGRESVAAAIANRQQARPRIRPTQLTGSDAGPLWFRKMDRNRDGDLSESEWLGSAADFTAADTNHDGLIDVEEAEAFSKARGLK